MVAIAADTRTVSKSRNIQSLTFPWALRDELAEESATQSGGEATEAETLCQKSDVAIRLPQISGVQIAIRKVGGTSVIGGREERGASGIVRLVLWV